MKQKTKDIRLAATTIILREVDGYNPFEILLLRRSTSVVFGGGFWVFPGGALDEADYPSGKTAENCNNIQMLDVVRQAAIREAYEESGIDMNGQNFVHYSHWVTPKPEKKRFSTWIMIARAPKKTVITVDDSEIKAHRWLAPTEAIALAEKGEIAMMPPTYISLIELSRCKNIDAVFAFAEDRAIPYFQPKIYRSDDSYVLLYFGDAAYENENINTPGSRHRMVPTGAGNGYNYINTLGRV